MLFIKSFIIGLGKIIPGVSGALIAINFGIYEKVINTLTDFFSDWKNNLRFLIVVFLGGILGIILGSKLIILLFKHYQVLTMMFFIGLIIGGSFLFMKKIQYNWINILIVIFSMIITALLMFNNLQMINITNYNLKFFIGGFMEVLASIVPGISATSLLMILGIYEDILLMIGNISNFNYIMINFNSYLFFAIGMMISFFLNIYLIRYLLSKHQNVTYSLILGLSITSIIYLLIDTLKLGFDIWGIIMLVMGIMISKYLV